MRCWKLMSNSRSPTRSELNSTLQPQSDPSSQTEASPILHHRHQHQTQLTIRSLTNPTFQSSTSFVLSNLNPLLYSHQQRELQQYNEFVDTEYYKQLNSIDKQHHMTGSGFIKVVREGGSDIDGLDLQLAQSNDDVIVGLMKIRSNPATNDWVPRTHEDEAWILTVNYLITMVIVSLIKEEITMLIYM